jgi:ubiquitin C-terminal hydrolase
MTGESKWKCPRCKQYRDAIKKIDIWRLPQLLIIHLKRFKYHGLWRDKIVTNVDYPINNLNLEKFVINSSEKRTNIYNYNLYATTNHTGTLDGGHYTAMCHHSKLNKWYKFDDTDVKEINDTSLLKSSSSYILFYSINNI